MAIKIHNLAVSGRLVLNLHSLNNEGTEGNQTLTRMVTVYIPDESTGVLESVNAVSGDMFKHIFAEHLRKEALKEGLPLSEGAKVGSANRFNEDFVRLPEGQRKDMTNEGIIDTLIQSCTVSDVCGLLVTEGKKSAPRKSVVEFGWVVGIPQQVRTESYFHVKYDPKRGEGSGQETVGQAIFHRPASSGAYATVLQMELGRIGVNDLSQKLVIDEADRKKRAKAALAALLHTYVHPQGAHRNTQNPHVTAFSGIVAWSGCTVPAPAMSALQPNYEDQVDAIKTSLNQVHGDRTIQTRRFASLADFTQILVDLIREIDAPDAP